MSKHQDIINLKHYEPKKHVRMTIENRAAQFAPFAALTGYDDAIMEAGRIFDEKIILSEDEQAIINGRIQYIKENIKNKVPVKITYFVSDQYNDGGEYQIIKGIVKRIDESNQIIILEDKEKILMDLIIEIEVVKDK